MIPEVHGPRGGGAGAWGQGQGRGHGHLGLGLGVAAIDFGPGATEMKNKHVHPTYWMTTRPPHLLDENEQNSPGRGVARKPCKNWRK